MRALTTWILVFVGGVAACRSTPSAAPDVDAGPARSATARQVAGAGPVTAGVGEPRAVPLPPSWPKDSFGRGGKTMVSLVATGPDDSAMLVVMLDPSLLTKPGP